MYNGHTQLTTVKKNIAKPLLGLKIISDITAVKSIIYVYNPKKVKRIAIILKELN